MLVVTDDHPSNLHEIFSRCSSVPLDYSHSVLNWKLDTLMIGIWTSLIAWIHGIPKITLYEAGKFMITILVSLISPRALTGNSIVPRNLVFSSDKPTSGSSSLLISDSSIFMWRRVAIKIKLTELPVSIHILDSSQLSISREITKASS